MLAKYYKNTSHKNLQKIKHFFKRSPDVLDIVRQKITTLFHRLKQLKKEDFKHLLSRDSLAEFYEFIYKINNKQKVIFSLVIILVAAVLALIKYNQNTMQDGAVFRRSVLSAWDYTSDRNIAGMKTSLKKEKTALAVLVERDDSQIEFQLPIDNPSLKVDGSTATYTNADKNIEVKYEFGTNKLKESIILNSPTNNYEFVSTFLVQNLIVKTNNENIPVFFDTNNNYQFHLERPYAIDAAGNTTFDLTYTLKPKNTAINLNPFTEKRDRPKNLLELETLNDIQVNTNEYELVVSVDPQWLTAPERQYPIIIDPTVIHDDSTDFSVGTFNRVTNTGSGTNPVLETYYQEITNDKRTGGLWHFNEVSGNALDSSGNGNTGTPTGTSIVTGMFGNSRSFNGTSDYIDVPGTGTLNFTKDFTLEAWIKTSDTGNVRNILTYGDTTDWMFALSKDSTDFIRCKIYIDSGGAAYQEILSATKPNDGNWHHIACTAYGNTLSLYIDGKLSTQSNTVSGTRDATSAGPLTIGAFNWTTYQNFFVGQIDEVRLSEEAKTPEEIKASAQRRPYSIYTSPVIDLGTNPDSLSLGFQKLSWTEKGGQTGDGEVPANNSGLVAQWNFNETSGNYANADSGNCGTSCNATLFNFSAGYIEQDASQTSGWTSDSRWGAGALKFDGTNDYASTVGAINYAPTTSSPFTVEVWVKPNNFTAGQAFIQTEDGTGTGRTLLGINSSTTTFYTNIGGVSLSASTIGYKPDEWYHVAVVYNGTGETLYVNGKAEGSASNIVEANNAVFTFGSYKLGSGGFFNGIMDSARVYSRALSAGEILDNYNATNIQFQTRVGADSTPDDGSWEGWKPANEVLLENFDNDQTLNEKIYSNYFGDAYTNQTWYKKNNNVPSNSDTTSNAGRIPLGTAGKADEATAIAPSVIKDGNTYKMWYHGYAAGNTTYRILYATSPDGINWTKYDNTILAASDTTGTNGRIPLGTNGKGDDAHVGYPNVIKDGNTYKMWYSGHDGSGWKIFYATSPDGLTWTKYDNSIETPSNTTGTNGRIPLGTDGSGDDTSIVRASVIKDGDIYKMWYSGSDGTSYRIYYATSPDGLTWTKYDNTTPPNSNSLSINGKIPLGGAGTADTSHVYEPTVIKDGSTYKMWYNMHNGNVRLGYAVSHDGLTWRKFDNSVPTASDIYGSRGRVPLGTGTTGDVSHAYGSTVIKDGSTYKMWYSGHYNGNWRIYHAYMTPVPATTEFDSNIKQEGTESQKITTGILQPDNNTIGLWRLNETGGTGAYIKDVSGNGHDGTPTSTTPVNGISGKAHDFNGSTSVVTVPADSALDFVGDYTLEAWIKPGSIPASTSGIIGKYSDNGWGLNITNTGLANMGSHSCSNFSGTTAMQPGQWYYVVGVYQENGNEYVYVNGNLEATGSLTDGNCANDTSAVVIGQFRTGILFDGVIDEVRVSNTARSADEIAENYRLGRDHYINYNLNTNQDLSNKSTLPFYIAADRPGTYLSANVGESAPANYQPNKNVAGLWHMDNTNSATVMEDSSGGNSGTISGAVQTTGVMGKGLYFDGTNDYATVADNESLRISDYTVSVWIWPDGTPSETWKGIVGKPGRNFNIWLHSNGYIHHRFHNDASTNSGAPNTPNGSINWNQWNHIVITNDGTTAKTFINGILMAKGDAGGHPIADNNALQVGRNLDASAANYFKGIIDEIMILNKASTDEEVRQLFDITKRTHSVTIDFGAKLDSGNLITNSGDTSFTVDATSYGLSNKGTNLFKGDKVIVRENYNGTEYIAQGTVNAITVSTGATTVSSWDSGSTFPSGGFTANAEVFKWQREFFDLTGSKTEYRNNTSLLTFKLTNGHEGRTIWLDEAKAATDYLTTPLSSAITSTTGNRYAQYRTIFTATDTLVSGSLSLVEIGGFDGATSSSAGSCYLEESPHDDQITIHWSDNATGELGFEIEKRINGGNSWDTLDRTSANVSSYNDNQISAGNTYQYRVRSFSDDGSTGDWCATSVVDLGTGSFRFEGLRMQGVKID